MTFFTADTHFWHTSILKYANRPFDSVEQMNAHLIDRWNEKVAPGDTVYHLGDFSFGTPYQAMQIREQLHGSICLIKGNHEKAALAIRDCFTWIRDVQEIDVEGQRIWLSHYAHRVWNKSHLGYWHLYGHSHGSLPDDPHSLSFDCGTDCHGYAPISFDEVATNMATKTFVPVDHHVPLGRG